MNKKGFFVFEGIDGSGKTTQINLLAQKLQDIVPHTHLTQEPTKSPLGLVLRDILTGKMDADPRVVSSLFATDRLNHILSEEGLLAQLAQGVTVLCDRYYFSSYAYHSVEQDMEKIILENSQNAQLLRPTATIYLDLSPDIAMERIEAGREQTELYESHHRLTMVRDNYFKAFQRLKEEETVLIFQANQDPHTLSEEIAKAVLPYLSL